MNTVYLDSPLDGHTRRTQFVDFRSVHPNDVRTRSGARAYEPASTGTVEPQAPAASRG